MSLGSCCRWTFGLLLLVVAVTRWVMRVPVHPSPPDVAVTVGAKGWEQRLRANLAEHGYAHVQNFLKQEEVESLRKLAQNYCYGEQRKALPLLYGGYSVPAFLDLPEFEGARWLPKDPRLHGLLEAAFNGTDYRFASHNDVGCDFVGVWHKDVLRGNVAKYQECDVWSPDEDGNQHEIYKVMFYLQDHVQDEQALKVLPGSHKVRTTPWSDGYVALHPRVGDTVIFDQRMSHAGNTFYDVTGKGRLFMQVGFGRKNRFTDEFERGTVERQTTLQTRMLKATPTEGIFSFLNDARFLLLGSALTALPPQLLNHFADKEILRHAEMSCAKEGRSSSSSNGQQQQKSASAEL